MNKTLLILGIVASCFACNNFRTLNTQNGDIFIRSDLRTNQNWRENNTDTDTDTNTKIGVQIIHTIKVLRNCFQKNLYEPIYKEKAKYWLLTNVNNHGNGSGNLYKLVNIPAFKQILGIHQDHYIIKEESSNIPLSGERSNKNYQKLDLFLTQPYPSRNIPVRDLQVMKFSDKVINALISIRTICDLLSSNNSYGMHLHSILIKLTKALLKKSKVEKYLGFQEEPSDTLKTLLMKKKEKEEEKEKEKEEEKEELGEEEVIKNIKKTIKLAMNEEKDEDSFYNKVCKDNNNSQYFTNLSSEESDYLRMVLSLYYNTEKKPALLKDTDFRKKSDIFIKNMDINITHPVYGIIQQIGLLKECFHLNKYDYHSLGNSWSLRCSPKNNGISIYKLIDREKFTDILGISKDDITYLYEHPCIYKYRDNADLDLLRDLRIFQASLTTSKDILMKNLKSAKFSDEAKTALRNIMIICELMQEEKYWPCSSDYYHSPKNHEIRAELAYLACSLLDSSNITQYLKASNKVLRFPENQELKELNKSDLEKDLIIMEVKEAIKKIKPNTEKETFYTDTIVILQESFHDLNEEEENFIKIMLYLYYETKINIKKSKHNSNIIDSIKKRLPCLSR